MSNLSVGIIGLPNTGKSTLFNALLKKQVAAVANFPFTTIEPNTGIVPVPDKRLDILAKIFPADQIIPTTIEFVDIAGLVKGAHQGKGLGNQFLSHIKNVDLIAEVVRQFTNPNVPHIEGRIDPQNDREIVDLELIMADLQLVKKRLEDFERKKRLGLDKNTAKLFVLLKKIEQHLNNGKPVRKLNFTLEEKELVKELNLLTIKPIVYVINIDENRIGKNQNTDDQIFLSAQLEAEIASLPSNEAQEFLKEFKLDQSGLDKLIITAYKKLNLITFYTTTKPGEIRAWTVKKGTKAPQAAGIIHSDFEKGFIKAEVISYQDLIKVGNKNDILPARGRAGFPSETSKGGRLLCFNSSPPTEGRGILEAQNKAKEKGLLRIEGKDYILQDGDIIHFWSSR